MSASLKRKQSPITSDDLQSNAINSRNYQYKPFRKRHRCSPRCCSTWLTSLVLPGNDAPSHTHPPFAVPKCGTLSTGLTFRNLPSSSPYPPATRAEGQLAQRGEALSRRHTHPPPPRWLLPATGLLFPARKKLSPPAVCVSPSPPSEAKFRWIGWALSRGPLRPPINPNDIEPLHLLQR